MLPALGKTAGVTDLQHILFAGDDPYELDSSSTENFHVGDVLVISEWKFNSFDVGILTRDGKRFD